METQALFNTVLDVLPLALTVKDARTGRYMLANRAAESLFDRPEGLVGLARATCCPGPSPNGRRSSTPIPPSFSQRFTMTWASGMTAFFRP